ncbi:hypothetical protein HJFPF1_13190 [Paramyrothecium foliicola]|nr:hypothetical protein HJFPF1_13190 [Paramyrothecium foliicola]
MSHSDPLATWTDTESGTFWPRDLVPEEPKLDTPCRVWVLKMQHIDKNLHTFQGCILLQNFVLGSLNVIEHCITSDAESASGQPEISKEGLKPNNGIMTMIGQGLGGVLAERIASLILVIPVQTLQGHHLGLKRKHWRVIVLGTPHTLPPRYTDDVEIIKDLVTYYGGSVDRSDLRQTHQF